MEKKVLEVSGMSCQHCVMAVERALGEIGVKASVNLNENTVTVEFDPEKVSIEQIISAIEEEGYDVKK